MPLDPDIATLLDQLSMMPRLEQLSPAEARATAALLSRGAPPGPALDSVEAQSVDTPAGPLALRVYRPVAAPRAILLYFHGGGWTIGSLDSVDAALRMFASRTRLCIVSVDYRLAPEHRFPAAIEDARSALAWVDGKRAELAASGASLLVGGDSAGGNIAAVLAILARDAHGPAIAGQLLFYPVTDADFDTPSYQDNAEGYFLTRPMMRWFWDQYLPDAKGRDDWRASPLRAIDLAGLPPALIQTAEFDPLRDEGEAYAARLAAAGVAVTIERRDGLIHGYVGMGQVPVAAAAIEAAARWVDSIA